jgi:hypothetical protein
MQPQDATPMATILFLLPCVTWWMRTADPTNFITPALVPPVIIHAPEKAIA